MQNLKHLVSRFSQLTETEMQHFEALFQEFPIKKKQFVLKEGQHTNAIFYFNQGIFRGFYEKDGEEITSNFYFGPTFAGDVFAARTKTPTKLNIQAFEDGQYFSADLNEIEKLSQKFPGITMLFLRFFEHLYIFNNRRQLSFIFDSPEERYNKLFLERPKVMANIPLKFIASYLGIKPETLSRIRRKM